MKRWDYRTDWLWLFALTLAMTTIGYLQTGLMMMATALGVFAWNVVERVIHRHRVKR